MTEKIGARAQIIDYICHCEAPKGPWQSHGSNGRETSVERYFPEIATGLTALAMTRLGAALPGLSLPRPDNSSVPAPVFGAGTLLS